MKWGFLGFQCDFALKNPSKKSFLTKKNFRKENQYICKSIKAIIIVHIPQIYIINIFFIFLWIWCLNYNLEATLQMFC